MASGETKDNQFAWIRLMLEAKFDDNPYWEFTNLF